MDWIPRSLCCFCFIMMFLIHSSRTITITITFRHQTVDCFLGDDTTLLTFFMSLEMLDLRGVTSKESAVATASMSIAAIAGFEVASSSWTDSTSPSLAVIVDTVLVCVVLRAARGAREG